MFKDKCKKNLLKKVPNRLDEVMKSLYKKKN